MIELAKKKIAADTFADGLFLWKTLNRYDRFQIFNKHDFDIFVYNM